METIPLFTFEDPAETFLLTGAGFSRNWGGLLASEVHDRLLSTPQVKERLELRRLIVEHSSFEKVLHICRTEMELHELTQILEDSIVEIFRSMDATYRDNRERSNVYVFQHFLNAFHHSHFSARTSFIFTLNQDTLLEREWYNFHVAGHPMLPGIGYCSRQTQNGLYWFSSNTPRAIDDLIGSPTEDAGSSITGTMNYIKLHGSCNWRKAGSKSLLVMGENKDSQLGASRLLASYLELFRTALCAGKRRLLVIGYGFGDQHINEIIADACKNAGLEIFICDPNIDGIIAKLRESEWGNHMLDALVGKERRPFSEIIPKEQQVTEELKNLVRFISNNRSNTLFF